MGAPGPSSSCVGALFLAALLAAGNLSSVAAQMKPSINWMRMVVPASLPVNSRVWHSLISLDEDGPVPTSCLEEPPGDKP